MNRFVQQFLHSPSSYPITIVYLAGLALAITVSEGIVDLSAGIAVLTLVAILAVLIALLREMRVVHTLVNSQRDELLLRIDVLVEALKDAGVAIPPSPDHRDHQ